MSAGRHAAYRITCNPTQKHRLYPGATWRTWLAYSKEVKHSDERWLGRQQSFPRAGVSGTVCVPRRDLVPEAQHLHATVAAECVEEPLRAKPGPVDARGQAAPVIASIRSLWGSRSARLRPSGV